MSGLSVFPFAMFDLFGVWGNTTEPSHQLSLPLADMQAAQLWMVAGFLILGWVLARRQMGLRKRVNREARAAHRELKKIRTRKEPVLPLSDAPPETQRWQVAMFDLQRELTAELDTRISIVQTLIHQVDHRIARLETLESNLGLEGSGDQKIRALSQQGFTAGEIAQQLSLPIADVELTLSVMPR